MSPGQDLAQRLRELEEKHGQTVRVEEIVDVVQSVMDSLGGDLSAKDLQVYRELEDLARYIERARSEISALRPGDIKAEYIPSATDELDAIVDATEAATHAILDATEAIEDVQATLEGEAAERINNAVIRIFEACNFQDITGQRITKIVKTLQHIEERVQGLMLAFGAEGTSEPAAKPAAAALELSDEDLLNGPQLPDNAKKQAEIDALLASFD